MEVAVTTTTHEFDLGCLSIVINLYSFTADFAHTKKNMTQNSCKKMHMVRVFHNQFGAFDLKSKLTKNKETITK